MPERSYSWACGKCGSKGLYRDEDFAVGDFAIACPMCGNRYYGDLGSRSQGVAPVKVYCEIKAAPPPAGPGHFVLERTANILKGQWRPPAHKKEESMSKIGTCRNCDRALSIVADGCCYLCYRAGKGLEGEEKAAALATVKAKIGSGTMRKGGGRRGPKTAAGKAAPGGKAPKPPRPVPDRPTPGFILAEARVPEGTLSISLDFIEACDRKLYDALLEQARRLRRTPKQQILWILQNAIEQETSLLAEASGRG